jgi:gliding motility-associated-like protein
MCIMKKQISLLLLFCFSYCISFAHHIVGGELYYAYMGPGATTGTSVYSVTLRLFRKCDAGADAAPLPGAVTVGVFNNEPPYTDVEDLAIQGSNPIYTVINLTTYPICISSEPEVCYQVALYTTTVTLPDNAYGYILSFQTCCRLGTANVLDNALNQTTVPGATYECIIPGTNILPAGHNSCAVFKEKDTALVCAGSKFSLDFGAVDPDPEDSVSYTFVAAYNGGDIMDASNDPPGNPLYEAVDYVNPYSAISPLGANVTLNPVTGLLSGIAPPAAPYVVCVQANEWRSGVLISSHRKDFILVVSSCNIPQATLSTSYINCGNFNFTFSNESSSILITSYYWNFGIPGSTTDTSSSSSPTYVYPDTGTYTVTLIVNRGQECTDTALSVAKVYPGFFPKFGVYGDCVNESYQFIDSTVTKNGYVNSWLWDFDSASNPNNFADTGQQNPTYKYADTGFKTIELIVGNNEGCIDTASLVFDVLNKPQIVLPFKDTLICYLDTLQLKASTPDNISAYNISWSPDYNINNTSIFDPLVSPQDTTTYVFTINDNKGCINTDSILVNVTHQVLVSIQPDTTICKTDSIQLNPNTNALYFAWSPPTGLSNPNIENPFAQPLTNTTYTVVASVGKCKATDTKTIDVVPYPQAQAFADTSICYGYTVPLQGVITGSSFTWSPVNSLLNSNTLNPIAGPQSTTAYILTAYDTLGCPKPKSDTVTVTVIPKVDAFAGDDTTIVVNQPLQLNATGGNSYVWTPVTGMNNPDIANPIVTLGSSFDSITYTVRVSIPQGCFSTDSVKVVIFKTQPEIFVPSAFTPNGDGKNDVLIPVVVGMKQLDFFRVYNRWGNLIFSTSRIGQGWDGTINGIKQQSGTYVFVAEAINYLGKPVVAKGTVVLIR